MKVHSAFGWQKSLMSPGFARSRSFSAETRTGRGYPGSGQVLRKRLAFERLLVEPPGCGRHGGPGPPASRSTLHASDREAFSFLCTNIKCRRQYVLNKFYYNSKNAEGRNITIVEL